jgi:hypothetical protein
MHLWAGALNSYTEQVPVILTTAGEAKIPHVSTVTDAENACLFVSMPTRLNTP